MSSPTAPQAPRPIPVKRDNQLSKKEKRQNWRDKKEQRQKYLVTAFLAVVFGLSTLLMFAFNPFEGMTSSAPQASSSGAPVPPEEAEIKQLSDEIDSNKAHPSALSYFNRGEAYYKEQKWPEAATDYRKAIELDPTDSMAMSHLGTVLLNEDNFKDAVPMLEKAESVESGEAAKRKAKGDEGDLRDINIPERLYEAYSLQNQKDKADAELAKAKDIDVAHLLGFLVSQSQQFYITKDNKAIAAQFADTAAKLGSNLAPQVKSEAYGQLAEMDAQMTQVMAILDKQPVKDPKDPKNKASAKGLDDLKAREAKMQSWFDMFMGALGKEDPTSAAMLSMTIDQMLHPPKPSPSAAAKAHASGSPAAPAAASSAVASPAPAASASAH